MNKPGAFGRYFAIGFMLAALGVCGWANATNIHWTPEQDKSGLTVVLPSININKLAVALSARQRVLEEDEKRLAKKVVQTQFTGDDAALAVILPGGLLYAGVKKAKHNSAVRAHDQVVAELKELKIDLDTINRGGLH